MSTDGLGNVYISGWTTGSLDGANAGEFDAFVAKYDAAGNLQWTQQLGTSSDDESFGVSTDGLGHIYFAAITRGELGAPNASMYRDAIVAKLSDSNIPEPSSLVLVSLSLVPFTWRRRRVKVHVYPQIANRRFASLLAFMALSLSASVQAKELFKLTPSDASATSRFGVSVALSGNMALVGAPDALTSVGASGAVYVFDVNTGQQVQKLVASDAQVADRFGEVVALDGGTALIPNSTAIAPRHFAYSFDI